MQINSLFFSTLFGLGTISKFPGTLASFFSLFIIWILKDNLKIQNLLILYIIILLFSLVVVSISLRKIKKKDPKEIVIDEFMGQFTTLLFLPNDIKFYVLGFLLFRFFDIIKPYPISYLDKKDDAIGVVFDDILAGSFAYALIHISFFLLSNIK